jgi:uncharacterized protein (TIGR00299 family) protein
MATDVDVELLAEDQGHGRHLADIEAIYRDSDLPPRVRDQALAIFTRLAEAEAKVHGTTPDKIHFHEVGAVDAIVDITGACILLEMLGVETVCSAPLPMSRGFVDCQHGRMPLPAPATAELLLGLPTYPVAVRGELVTPTGAALVATLSEGRIGDPPAMVPSAVGYGAGKKDWGTPFPNLLRVFLGEARDVHAPDDETAAAEEGEGAAEPMPAADTVAVLETNLDDAAGETIGYVQERLLAAGALDVFCVPIQMKKNRPGTLLTVLAVPEAAELLAGIVFAETGTFGIRRTVARRECLDRRWQTVETPFGAVRLKIGSRDGHEVTVSPEYEDCRGRAAEHCVPLRDVYRAAVAAARRDV